MNAGVLGKIVLYADRDFVAPDLTRFNCRPGVSGWPGQSNENPAARAKSGCEGPAAAHRTVGDAPEDQRALEYPGLPFGPTLFASVPAPATLPYMADIPLPGSKIVRGQPICTLFARAETVPDCLRKLIRRSKRIYQQRK
jgi:hypothetical protein